MSTDWAWERANNYNHKTKAYADQPEAGQLPLETWRLLTSVNGRGPELLRTIQREKDKVVSQARSNDHVKKAIALTLLIGFSSVIIATTMINHGLNWSDHWGLYLIYLVVCQANREITEGKF